MSDGIRPFRIELSKKPDAVQRGSRERFTGRQLSVSLPPRRSKPTRENGVEHSGSRCFADTEEVTGSNPVAPTIYRCSLGRVCAPGLLDQASVAGPLGSTWAATAV